MRDLVRSSACGSLVERGQDGGAVLLRDELQRLVVHRALDPGAVGALPGEGEEHARRRSGEYSSRPRFSSRAMVLLAEPTGPCSSSTRRSVP